MAEKGFITRQRNAQGTWDIMYPQTRADMVLGLTDLLVGFTLVDFTQEANNTGVTLTLSGTDGASGNEIIRSVTIPSATNTLAGLLSPETYTAIQNAITDIASLKAANGVWLGQNFATKAALAAFVICHFRHTFLWLRV